MRAHELQLFMEVSGWEIGGVICIALTIVVIWQSMTKKSPPRRGVGHWRFSSGRSGSISGGGRKTQRVNHEAAWRAREVSLQQQSRGIPQGNTASPENRMNIIPERPVQKGAAPSEQLHQGKEQTVTASNSLREEKSNSFKKEKFVLVQNELSVERLMEVVNDVLDMKVMMLKPQTLVVSSADFVPIITAAATGDMDKIRAAVPTSKLSRVFEQRARESGSGICYGCRCWNRCSAHLTAQGTQGAQGTQDAAVTAMLHHVKELSAKLILTCLTEESWRVESEAELIKLLYQHGLKKTPSRQTAPRPTTKTQELLECIANWDEDGMTPELLQIIFSKTEDMPNGYLKWVNIVRSVGAVLDGDHRMDEHFYKYGKMLAGVKTLFKSLGSRFILLKTLTEEVQAAKVALGSYFERESVFGSVLAVSAVPACFKHGINLENPKADMWTSLKGFPKLTENDVLPLWKNMSKGQQLVNRVVACGLKEAYQADAEVTVTWLSYMMAYNELRTTVTPPVNINNQHSDIMLSDGFMLNVCYILLDLCLPFCGDMEKIAKIDPSYTTSPSCHLGYSLEPCLAGGLILAQEEKPNDTYPRGENPDSTPKRKHKPNNTSPREENPDKTYPHGENPDNTLPPKSFNFMTNIFHITLRAINIGLMPALQQFLRQMSIMNESVDVAEELGGAEELIKQRLILSLQWEACIKDYDFLQNGTRFYLTVCLWISHLLDKAKEGDEEAAQQREQQQLQQVPEFVIKDMAHWFTFIASHATVVHRDLLKSLQVDDFIKMCILFLTRRDLLPGPIPASALCEALVACIDSSKVHAKDGWVVHNMSSLESAVQYHVHMHKTLCPGLVRTYISVDVVEGLDVDKDDFDKYQSRFAMARLLTQLWKHDECKESVLRMCGGEHFQSFLGAIFDTLLYQLHDSLARLANVRKLELTKRTWRSLPPQERWDKARFLRSEENTAKGFMAMARETLTLLELMTESDEVAKCLTVMPIAKRAASALLGFLESLCGSRSEDFTVDDMKKYDWEPHLLIAQLVRMVLQIVKQEEATSHFTSSLATDLDFNPATMTRALQVLCQETSNKEDLLSRFSTLTTVLRNINVLQKRITEVNGRPNWREQLNRRIDQDQLDKDYQAQLRPLCYDSAAILETHAFQSNAVTMPVDARSKCCRALMKEMRTWMVDLPIQAHAAIFLRQDEERMDVVRAVVTGPHDTPYSLGCFVFDIYFPPTYPNIPLLVKFITTGGGTIRFNPNLYADGKVCLSLLGTWHGGDASQKWQTGKSSLYQVLLSIQSMILISTPMYNEPGYEGIQGTKEGNAQSRHYNAKLRLLTLRHAVLSQIVHPPKGFETVIKRHFFCARDALKKQCHDWLQDTEEPELQHKLQQVVQDICTQLDKLSICTQLNQEQEQRVEEAMSEADSDDLYM